MEPKVLMVFVVAVDEADRDPTGNRSLRHLLGEAGLWSPPEIAELDNHVHTVGRQPLDHPARPHRIRMRITHQRDAPAHWTGKYTTSHQQTLRPAPIPTSRCLNSHRAGTTSNTG